MPFRRTIAVIALAAFSPSAHAETWMVKVSTQGCFEREMLAAVEADGGSSEEGLAAKGCVSLEAGERLLEIPGMATGFDDYVRLQRHDKSFVYVRSSAVVPDPGIGSVYDER